MSRDERGAVTAETAVVLPLLVAVTLSMVWLVAVGLAQMRATDAAREAARALARGESVARAEALARQAAPGIGVRVVRSDGEVRVVVDQRLAPPDGARAPARGGRARRGHRPRRGHRAGSRAVTAVRAGGRPPQGQRGSASLPAVTLSGVVLLLGLAAAFVTATAAAHRRAESAADLAALAGAVAGQRGEDYLRSRRHARRQLPGGFSPT